MEPIDPKDFVVNFILVFSSIFIVGIALIALAQYLFDPKSKKK